MRESGYGKGTSKNPKKLTGSKGWEKLCKEHLGDDKLTKKHNDLLNATRIEHMTFLPLPKKGKKKRKGEVLTDEMIKELLISVNCQVRKIVHGEQARHVYFWAADNNAVKNALDMAYKIKGKYAPEKHEHDIKQVVHTYLPEKK